MQKRAVAMRIIGLAILVTGCGESASGDRSAIRQTVAEDTAAIQASPDDLAFSIDNMDLDEDPRKDFLRFAAGGWIDRVPLPEDKAQIGFMTITDERVNEQMAELLAQTASNLSELEPGSPAHQVGVIYNAYLDVEAIDSAGVEPLRSELDRLEAVASKDELAKYLGHFSTVGGSWPFFEIDIFEDLSDASHSAVYVAAGERALRIGAIFASPEDSPLRQIYKDYAAAMLRVAGYDETRANAAAVSSLAIDTILHGGEMDPVLKVDIRNLDNPRTFDELQAEVPDLDFEDYFLALGLDRPDKVISMDPEFTAAASRVLDEFSLRELKDYLALRLIQSFDEVLTSDFDKPRLAVIKALLGAATIQPREERVVTLLQETLGQPIGRLYVESFFDRDEQKKGLDMIRRVQAAFRARVQANDWMSDETRNAALEKVDKLYYRVGYPDQWIDYSEVAVSPDLVQTLVNIRRFDMARLADKQGRQTDHRAFTDPESTLPTIVNAAYNPSINGFEVTAAIAQPPTFQPDMDAPVYFCRLGAVIGHEMTHGFDSGGRNFDSQGNLRNWWTESDAARFGSETQKLIDLGSAYEALPGTFMNGGLTVTENLADIGGITLAHAALMRYLDEHPEENAEIDGFTPEQRCFIAWSQLWAEKRSDASMRAQMEDNHAPGVYRAVSPLQHVDAFYAAFGIERGDPMWLPPEERVDIW